jgi:glycine/D-amino acid oxidase-like deaminating enzyme
LTRYDSLSFWHDTVGESLDPRPGMPGDTDADVAIVGAGFTGLWTAYYLKRQQPDLRVVVIESEIAGFGASGRNGGWCLGEMAGDKKLLAKEHGREPVLALMREMFSTVDEIGKVAAAEGIDCHFHKGGILTFARNTAQFVSLQNFLQHERWWGFGPEDFRWLGPAELSEHAHVAGSQGALFTPHGAALHPARLARGLARVVEGLGVSIYEQTRAETLEPKVVKTNRGMVKADAVLRCTEAFTVAMPGLSRTYIPVYSLMVATEPLPASFWDKAGFADRPTFNDARRLIIYGQRTADGRLAFGGRGARYHFGSRLNPAYERNKSVHDAVTAILLDLFPDLSDHAITHRWGGAVAIPRDWQPSVRFDRNTGMGHAGGYVGDGVAAANLGGRTLADLVLRKKTDLTRLPWVGHRSKAWEPEPLRWIGANLASQLVPIIDRREAASGRPSRVLAGALKLLTGR